MIKVQIIPKSTDTTFVFDIPFNGLSSPNLTPHPAPVAPLADRKRMNGQNDTPLHSVN